MNTFKYQIHLLINNRYYFIIKLLIFFCIYLSFYFPTISYCMTEGNDVPQIAEAKDSIIQMLQEQIKNLQIENKSLRDTMVSSFKETQDLQRAQLAELKSLRADTVTAIAQPVIAEVVAEAKIPEEKIDYESWFKDMRNQRDKYYNDLNDLRRANRDYYIQCEEKHLAFLEAKQKFEHEMYLNRHPNYRRPAVPLDRFPQGYVPYISGGHPGDIPHFGSLPENYTLVEPPHRVSGGGIERITRQTYEIKPGSRYMQEIYYPPNSAGNGYKPATYETTFDVFAESTEEYNRKRGIR